MLCVGGVHIDQNKGIELQILNTTLLIMFRDIETVPYPERFLTTQHTGARVTFLDRRMPKHLVALGPIEIDQLFRLRLCLLETKNVGIHVIDDVQ